MQAPLDLQDFIKTLQKEKDIIEITTEVDPFLEAAEIHRRIIEEGGPAILFRNIKGGSFPLVTNLFGTQKRIDLAFGSKPLEFMKQVAKLPETLIPPTLGKLWSHRSLLSSLAKVGLKRSKNFPRNSIFQSPPKLTKLPLLTTWLEDGGPFITLPLVYTEHPETHVPNLGMYRLQRYDDSSTGFHCQIGKGAGFHLHAARELNQKLAVNVSIGGPPALILSAIAPLPENVPELLLASLVLGKKFPLSKNPFGPLPIASNAEFTLVGEVDPFELKPEGPFGDHYGYYSLQHDYPVFRLKGLVHKKNAVCAATVVGKPRQEDFYLGDYLQELLSPLFPLVMPAVKDLWSYGETGYHSLASAVVKQRYKREAMSSAFRILGEGQLSLTKFLLLVDKEMDLRDFPKVLTYILERCDFRTDLYIFSNLSMDTLDYNGPKVNEGSKGVMLGVGDSIRSLPKEFSSILPSGINDVAVFCPGCLVVSGTEFKDEPALASRIAEADSFSNWPLIVLVDDAKSTAATSSQFLWTAFTRFEPGGDLFSKKTEIQRNHISYTPPIVIDARMKPHLPAELVCDDKTRELVDSRWKSYFLNN